MAASPSGQGQSATPTTSLSWQQLIYSRLQERDAREKQQDAVLHNYNKLAMQARLLKQRNLSLLTASSQTATTSAAVTATAKGDSPDPAATQTAASNPVHMAYISTLESQLATHRDEVAALYKTQGQNAQRLLVMNESLREREEECRRQAEEITRLSLERDKIKRSADDLANVVGEKEKGIQVLQDELAALSLELSQIEARNEDLKKDNASLLQRWLDKMNEEAEKMNEGTRWLEEERKRRQQQQSDPALADVPNDAAATAHPKQDSDP